MSATARKMSHAQKFLAFSRTLCKRGRLRSSPLLKFAACFYWLWFMHGIQLFVKIWTAEAQNNRGNWRGIQEKISSSILRLCCSRDVSEQAKDAFQKAKRTKDAALPKRPLSSEKIHPPKKSIWNCSRLRPRFQKRRKPSAVWWLPAGLEFSALI